MNGIARHRVGFARSAIALVLAGGSALSLSAAPLAAQNFVGSDRSLAFAAEAARERSSAFWLGEKLGARWSAPCPITVNALNGPGWGNTQFAFARHEVFGWRTQVSGSRQAIIADVLPQEVDHMVRASLTRRPIVRWLDEGCAALFESPAAHRRLPESGHRLDPSILSPSWLDAADYPPASQQRDELYSFGFSLAEFLLERAGPKQLLEFQCDPRLPTAKLADHFGLAVADLRRHWHSRHSTRLSQGTDCTLAGCLMHPPLAQPLERPSSTSAEEEKPLLVIWTSRWCAPCRTFWNDWHRNPSFRDALQSRLRIQIRDVDVSPLAASASRIASLPTFELADRRVVGYAGMAWLQRKLGLLDEEIPHPEATSIGDAADIPASQAESAGGPSNPSNVGDDALSQRNAADPAAPTSSPNDLHQTGPSQTTRATRAASPPAIGPLLGLLLSALPASGVVGGMLATGGAGGILLALGGIWLRHRWGRRRAADRSNRGSARSSVSRPLDEARQLIQLRQREGGSATLDALRGMFLEDELEKLRQSSDPAAHSFAGQLKSAIDRRIEEVAPLAGLAPGQTVP